MTDRMNNSEYQLRVTQILSSFRMLEFSLKLYISGSYKIVVARLDELIPFEYGYKDIKNLSLGRLLDIFSKVNANKTLQARLKTLCRARNDVAHLSLLYRHDVVQAILGIDTHKFIADLKATEIELDRCLIAMTAELDANIAVYNELTT